MWTDEDGDKYQLRALVTGARVERENQNRIIELLEKQNKLLQSQLDEMGNLKYTIEHLRYRRWLDV